MKETRSSVTRSVNDRPNRRKKKYR